MIKFLKNFMLKKKRPYDKIQTEREIKMLSFAIKYICLDYKIYSTSFVAQRWNHMLSKLVIMIFYVIFYSLVKIIFL